MDRRTRTFVGAGALGVSAVLAAAPVATAAVAGTHPTAADAGRGGALGTRPAGARQAAPRAPIAPDYGYQKVRVGVDGTAGNAFPTGTSTVGTKITIVETGPNATPTDRRGSVRTVDASADSTTFTCATIANDQAAADVHIPTWCPDQPLDEVRSEAARGAHPDAHTGAGDDLTSTYSVQPGDTATITQTTVGKDLTQDTQTVTIKPCTAVAGEQFCGNISGNNEDDIVTTTNVVFDDDGPLPVARPNSARTAAGSAVEILVTDNDSTGGVPQTGLSIVSQPGHGTATIVSGGSASSPSAEPSSSPAPVITSTLPAPVTSTVTGNARPVVAQAQPAAGSSATASTIRYTPAAGFSGTDRFRYRLSTANGSSITTVTIVVAAAASSSPPSSSAPVSSVTSTSTVSSASAGNASTSAAAIANTGTDSRGLGGLALGLIVTGGAATVVGRRRRTGRHA